ncbi:MAG: type I restriction enzyme HsdR N-terminal domain-containing protein, partial [Pseudomonadota bacterium]
MRPAPSVEAETESDVEQKIVFPLLNAPDFLGIASESIKTKNYLAPSALDKAAGKRIGYYPDYSVWVGGYPVLIVEAKAPDVEPAIGYREASLYARHLNSQYAHGLNPCQLIIASNGKSLLAGYWDVDTPEIDVLVDDIKPGTQALADLRAFCGGHALQAAFAKVSKQLNIGRAYRPSGYIGGQALLNSKRPLNSFAAELSPVLRRFFSSSSQTDVREIAKQAYVSSSETTDYDRVLESLLKDRVSARRDTIVQPIQTSKGDEPQLTRAITDYSADHPPSGQLQIIQGGVGAGKSLFARRYREILQPAEMAAHNFWAFIDFNEGPPSLKGAETWLCEQFITSFERENPALDLYEEKTLRGIFSRRIQTRKGVYAGLKKVSQAEVDRVRALDLSEWQADPQLFTEGLGNYVGGVTQSNLIVVMDNVDRLDLASQLDAFQLALWFMGKTRAFVILQMRDETYERYKNKPPLDTFRAGIAFHISPPRFIDVVKRRLELGIEYLAAHTPKTQEFVLDNGYRMIVPSGELGMFLHRLYIELFGKRRNVARVLEALSGSDVRRALEMFVSIVTSGHLSASAITSNVLGEGAIPLAEFHIIRILMRTEYRFFSERSGYVTNIFHYEDDWDRDDNLLLSEILYFLGVNR